MVGQRLAAATADKRRLDDDEATVSKRRRLDDIALLPSASSLNMVQTLPLPSTDSLVPLVDAAQRVNKSIHPLHANPIFPPLPPTVAGCTGLIKHALYLFSGAKRRSSFPDILSKQGWLVQELDIIQSRHHDLTRKHLQSQILAKIDSGCFGVVAASPPCNTFTRVKFANSYGPPPTRNKQFPRGLPWCSAAQKTQNHLGNCLADFAFTAISHQIVRPYPNNQGILEHPEDLGIVGAGKNKGQFPASIWQFPQHQECVAKGAISIGIRQSDFKMPYVKPTRLLLKVHGALPSTFFPGLPTFLPNGSYSGPIPKSENHTATLAKTRADEAFRTTGTAAWPPLLSQTLADLVSVPQAEGVSFHDSKSLPALTSKDVDDDFPPPPLPSASSSGPFPTLLPHPNYNRGGSGPPRSVMSLGKTYQFNDGGGLCSPGRWEKHKRTFATGQRWDELRNSIKAVIVGSNDQPALMKQIVCLFCGKEDVFNMEWPVKVRSIIHEWLSKQSGDYPGSLPPSIAEGQPFYLDIIKYMLKEADDPDFAVCDDYKVGVNLGVTEPLPHTPAVFELQTQWRLKDNPLETSEWFNANYSTVDAHIEAVQKQFDEEVAEGMMGCLPLEEFKSTFTDGYAISALSVLEERDKLRVLHDATHVTRVNFKIKTRDKLRTPGPREKAFLLNGYKARKRIAVSLLGDFSKAHRRVKVRERDWGWQGCTLDGIMVYYNRVGTFGVGSAAYWWQRLGAILVRLIFILLGPNLPLDTLLFADDLEMVAEHPGERLSILVAIVVLLSVGAPMKWSKFRGGYQLDWVGYHFCHKEYTIGISLKRAEWVVNWVSLLLSTGSVNVLEFFSGLGRLNFVAGALIYDRPFLGLLYLWSSAVIGSSIGTARLPWACRIVLFWISRRMREDGGRMVSSSSIASIPFLGPRLEVFRSDAKATDTGAWIGGWEYLGGQPCKSARWFAFQVEEQFFPWAFCKKDPKRVIASLELLATIVCIILFGRQGNFNGSITGSTDNQSNTWAVKKLMSTRFPLTILLMELSEQLRVRSASLDLSWLPRDSNIPADDLTNQIYEKFSMDLRMDLDPKQLGFLVLDSIQESSQILFDQISREKESARLAKASSSSPTSKPFRRKTAVKDRLKWTQPW